METKIQVLIADPGEDARQLLTDMLSREEDIAVCGCAADGMEALEKITELDPDVVILELVLPRLDGLGVLRKLPDTERSPAVLVMTGFVTPHVVAESAELGAAVLDGFNPTMNFLRNDITKGLLWAFSLLAFLDGLLVMALIITGRVRTGKRHKHINHSEE